VDLTVLSMCNEPQALWDVAKEAVALRRQGHEGLSAGAAECPARGHQLDTLASSASAFGSQKRMSMERYSSMAAAS